jgi:hypothetical protein
MTRLMSISACLVLAQTVHFGRELVADFSLGCRVSGRIDLVKKPTISSSAGHAFDSSHADFVGQTTSYLPCTMYPLMCLILWTLSRIHPSEGKKPLLTK